MGYVGNTPAEKYASFAVQNFTVTATTNYTLDHPVANENDIRLVINNVVQHPGSGKAYTASGTTLTLSEATAGTDTMYCVFLGKAVQTVTPSNSSVTNAMLVADSVNGDKIADNSISDEHLDNTAITGQTAITSLADTDKFLVSQASDSGNLKYVEKQYLGGGAFNLISATAVTDSVTAFNIANVFSSSYQMYMMIMQNVRVTADCNIRLRFGASGTYHSSGYRYVGIGRDRSGVDRSYNGTGDTSMLIVKELDGNDILSHGFGVYYFANPNISATNSNRKRVTGHYTVANAAGNSTTTTYNFAGELEVTTTAMDGIRLFVDAGNFRGGVAGDGDGMIKIYGIADS